MANPNPRKYTRHKEDNLNGILHPQKAKHQTISLTDRLLQEANREAGYDLRDVLNSKGFEGRHAPTSFDASDELEFERWRIQSHGEYHSYMARWCRERAPFIQDEQLRKQVWEQSYQHQEVARVANEFLIGKTKYLPKPAPINMILGRRN